MAEGGEQRGYDGGKRITGRKRHIAVDTLGLVMAVVVPTASGRDYDRACFVFQSLRAEGHFPAQENAPVQETVTFGVASARSPAQRSAYKKATSHKASRLS